MPRLTETQRRDIVTIASLKKGLRPRYPIAYITALFGVSPAHVHRLLGKAGLPTRDKYCTRSVHISNDRQHY